MLEKVSSIKFSSVGPRGLMNFYRREPKVVIRNIKKLWPLYLKNILPHILIRGNKDYTKFIILGRSRTGSNLLRGSLMSHDNIIIFGDLFRLYNVEKPKDIYWGLPLYPQTKRVSSLRQQDPVAFLETEVFGKFPGNISAVGFKVLYPHAYPESWEPVLTYLRNEKSVKVIHIKRRNVLKTHLSLRKVDQRKDKWVNISDGREEHKAISLDFQDCLNAFVNTKKWEEEHDDYFKDHDKIDVVYEDLSSNYEREMSRIQEFLNVNYQPVKPLTYKQASQPLSKAVSNYFELKAQFKGTPWETLFEE